VVGQITWIKAMYNFTSNSVKFEPSLSLRNFVTFLCKRKRIIASFFVTVVGTVTLGSFIMSPIYRAAAKVLVERELDTEKALLFRMEMSARYENFDWLVSETEIIKSHPLAERVVAASKLDRPTAKKVIADTASHFEKAVLNFQKELKAENVGKSNVIEISYENKDPRLVAEVVNRVVATYMAYRAELFNESSAYKFFEEQMHVAGEKLRTMEQNQATFKQEQEALTPEEQRQILVTNLTDYEKSLTTVRTERIGREAKLTVIKDQLRKGYNDINFPTTETSDSPSREKYIAKLKGDLLDMEIRRERMLQKFKPQYEEVVDLNKQISATKAKIRSEIREIVNMEMASIRALKAEEDELQASIEKINSQIKDLAQNEFEYSQISRGIEDSREVYSTLLKQREEARISLAKLESGVKTKLISPAVVPLEPVKPRKKIYIALAILLGLLGGLGLAYLVEYFDHSIDTPAKLEKLTGLPVLGSVREIHLIGLGSMGHDKSE
jgi:succinoglycan biosynthesis transport protein ExoP